MQQHIPKGVLGKYVRAQRRYRADVSFGGVLDRGVLDTQIVATYPVPAVNAADTPWLMNMPAMGANPPARPLATV